MISALKGFGYSVPCNVVTNQDLEKLLDTSDKWIKTRSGINSRFIAIKETTSSLGCEAAKKALSFAALSPNDVDLVIVATTTPDHIFPSVATKIQHELKIPKAFAFDVQAVCSGFLYALSIADQYIKSGTCMNVLVIGVDVMSKILNWNDRSTAVLFGDGAGAVLLQAEIDSPDEPQGIVNSVLYSDGSLYESLYVKNTWERCNADSLVNSSVFDYLKQLQKQQNEIIPTLVMNGREVFKHAVSKMISSIQEVLNKSQISLADIDYFVPHQANIRILKAVTEHLKFPWSKVLLSLDSFANTSAATIPLTLSLFVENKTLKKGDLILSSAAGGGFTWGSSLFYI
jgi:3-oxoacyl-[acyl-carrier-protein] synthase-3